MTNTTNKVKLVKANKVATISKEEKKALQKAARQVKLMAKYDEQGRLHIDSWTLNVSRIRNVLVIKGFDNNAIYTVTNVDNAPFIEAWSKLSDNAKFERRDFNETLVENNAKICKNALLQCFSGLSFNDVMKCSKVAELTPNKSNRRLFDIACFAENNANVKNDEIAQKKANAKKTV